ncbi:hypothetical protein D3C78_593920 [compost metagenome]
MQIDVLGQLVAGHGVVAPVRIDHHAVCHVAEHIVDVEGAAADGELRCDVVGGPQGQAVVRRVGHLVAVVVAIDQHTTYRLRATVDQLGIHVGVSGEHLPGVGQLTGGGQLQAVDAALACVLVGVGIDQYSGIFLLGAKHRGSQVQALVKQVPFGADFVVGGFLGFQLTGGGSGQQRVAVAAFTQRGASRCGRGGIRNVNAAVFRRLPGQAQLAGNEFAGVFGLEAGRTACHFGFGFGIEMVVAQAHGQQPGRIQLEGVGQVDSTGVASGIGTCIGTAHVTTPGFVRVWVGE